MNLPPIFLSLVLVGTIPSGLTTYWDRPEMILALPVGKVDPDVGLNAIHFWRPYVRTRIYLRFQDGPPGACTVLVEYGGSDPRNVAIAVAGQATRCHDDLWCISDVKIILYDKFFSGDANFQVEILAHEIGHIFGLPHKEGTLMSKAAMSGMYLDGEQIALLRRFYGGNVRSIT